ncbi:transglycosylase domain-containing protein [Salirhabdus salicampi]|uniref:transglycosylase domain-containing protein n=1 Tax=Salirhabdus salicampi TaxID=476102 RepID=UPI0020C38913|nr:PBP1A family penicillin-binding protein [Salirhabdus salicampi]MCP8615521.1 PBP1A family penicillin-binding protein [Salirhabdus salicampi]
MKKFLIQFLRDRPILKWASIIVVTLLFFSISGYFAILLGGKSVVDEKSFVFSQSTVIQTAEGDVVAKIYDENRKFVPIEMIPEHVQNAFIAIEDNRFYEHAGVDFIGVLRAVYRDIVAFDKVQGGSTITQQLIKNHFLSSEKTVMRKSKEAMGAIYLERKLSKKKILEYYLNEIYFGHGAYGIEEAAQLYFSKSVQNLTISEGALLAALPKAPNTYSPITNNDQALQRRNIVLRRMQALGMIDAETSVSMQGRTLGVNYSKTIDRPWLDTYIDIVLQEAEEKYHISKAELYRGGYEVVTAIDPFIQETAYEAFQNDEYFQGSQPNIEGAFVLLDQNAGSIVAAVGGRQYKRGDLNRVFVKRQPGSVIKPLIVYGPALELNRYSPYSLLQDHKTSYGDYTPKNYDDRYDGEVTMYDALVTSKNAPAVWLLNEIGITHGKKYFQRMGIELPDKGLAVALGGLEEGLTPLEIVLGYRALSNNGVTEEPYSIIAIKDRNGSYVGKATKTNTRVFNPQTAWYMTKMLQAVVKEGTGREGEFNKALAGKTGSTQHPSQDGYKDVWFAGYTPAYVGAIWMGYDRTDENHYLTRGSGVPTRLFKDILSKVDKQKSLDKAFLKPTEVKELPDPVQLPIITDLTAKRTFSLFSGISVQLSWSGSSDERIIYRVYEEKAGQDRVVGQVIGESLLIDNEIGILDVPTYYVIPYNPYTNKAGETSNRVKVQ